VRDSRLGRPFWTLWSAFTASNLGDGLTLVVLPLLAVAETGDARLVALVAAVRVVPYVVLGLPAGLILDRFDRRVLAVIAQVARAVVIGALAFIVARDGTTIGVLVAAALVMGAGEVLIDGGLPAIVRDLVATEQLEVANSRLSATQTVSNLFIGPPLGALLFELDPALPLIAVTALFLAGAVALVLLPGSYRPELDPDAAEEPLRRRLTEGLRYVWSHPVLRPLALTVAVFAFVNEASGAVYVILVTERFGLGSLGFGLLISIEAITSVAASFGIAGLVARTSHSWSMRFSIVTFTISSFLLGFSTVVAIAFLAALINGASDPTWNVVSATVRQRLVPDAVFGRMMTAYLFIAWGMQPIGAVLGGVMAEAWGAEWVFVMSGVGVGALFFLARPMFRAVDAAMQSGTEGV
jgi:MFS family permease